MATPILKLCLCCKELKPLEECAKSPSSKDGRRSMCKPCFNAYYAKRRVEKYELVRSYERKFHRERRLKYQFGITPDQYSAMFKAQDGKCAICKTATKHNLCVDHCHASGNVRGLLCTNCNAGLGLFKDAPALMAAAGQYIRKYAKSKNLPNINQGPLLWAARVRKGRSGVEGVRIEGDAFVAIVSVNGVEQRIGRFATVELAAEARAAAMRI